MRKTGVSVPHEFEGKIDEFLLKKTIDYEAEKTRFSLISAMFSSAVTVIFIFCGLLNFYNSWIASLDLSFIVSGWLFFYSYLVAANSYPYLSAFTVPLK